MEQMNFSEAEYQMKEWKENFGKDKFESWLVQLIYRSCRLHGLTIRRPPPLINSASYGSN
ncbi:hypothetical protein [Hahella sp. HN01]|uniref:hypothetical protein n=1 Tax=Hahella sp. HN01 TaxID=2847262 RepID=UPI001C1F100D|nr:hypothetical protein [Hahella sp. HN01]MBU6955269.1 hypothetical protein [Hahella sp. HN01]